MLYLFCCTREAVLDRKNSFSCYTFFIIVNLFPQMNLLLPPHYYIVFVKRAELQSGDALLTWKNIEWNIIL